MEENKDKKTENTGKLQLKKTFNVGQIKQSFSHGRTRSVSVEIKKKRVLRGLDDKTDLTKEVTKKEDDFEIGGKNQKLDNKNQEQNLKSSAICSRSIFDRFVQIFEIYLQSLEDELFEFSHL